jgi:hypothetical protein
MERRLGGALAVRPEILFPQPHRRDLAATGRAGAGRSWAAGGVEPGGGHWNRLGSPAGRYWLTLQVSVDPPEL